MSLIIASTLAAALAVSPTCSWDRPGHDPFMGDVALAVERYTDIPRPVLERLQQRMARRDYDEIVRIERDRIVGRRRYADTIRDMHFGPGRLCRTVTRARWTDAMVERGLVYCEQGHCILVPTVCRNVSRLDLLPDVPVALAMLDAPGDVETLEPVADELELDPPSAGLIGSPEPSFALRSADPWGPVEPRVDPPPNWPPIMPPIMPPTVPPPVPEPPSTALMFVGLAAVVAFVTRRRAPRR